MGWVKKMSDGDSGSTDRRRGEGIIGAISAGLFFVLVGVIFMINPNLWSRIVDFVNDFTTVHIANTSINLPVPVTPAAHTTVYSAVFQFALGIAILQILILVMRLTMGSRTRRIAQSVGSLVFWTGAAYMSNNLASMKSTLAISQQHEMWFQFWAAIIILTGLSIIARAAVLLAARR